MAKVLKDVITPITEITIGENEFTIKSITLSDISDFQAWCDVQKKKEIIEVYKLAEQTVSVKEVMSITGDQDYYDSQMNTIKGVIYLLHKVIKRHNDTNITIEELSNEIDIKKIEEIVNILFGSFLEDDKSVKNVKAESPKVKK